MATDYIREFLEATRHLAAAAKDLKRASGDKPLAHSLSDAAKAMLQPEPLSPDRLKQNQFEMVRALVSRTEQYTDGRSDPTQRTKPTRFSRYAGIAGRHIGRQLGAKFGRTRAGRFVQGAAKTKAGKAVGKIVMRAAGSVGARAGVSAGAGAVAGGGTLAAGASILTGVGVVVGALALVGTALYAFGKVVVAASDKQLEAMRQYEKVSSGMAFVFAQADMRDTLRNMERGNRLAPSAQSLSNADQKLKDNSSEIIVLVETIKNGILTLLESGIAELIQPLNEMARGVIEWLKRNGLLAEGQEYEAFDSFLDRVSADAAKSLQAGDRWHAAARADRR